ncbi:MAG: hypothetical protein WA954_11670 [Parerythrobacter sp.]
MTGRFSVGMVLSALCAMALAMVGSAASARDLVRLLETEQGSIVLLDRFSIAPKRADANGVRTAIVSIDNSRVRSGVQFVAADLKIRAQCGDGRLRVLRFQAFDLEGAPVAVGGGINPAGLILPGSAAERAILDAICETP